MVAIEPEHAERDHLMKGCRGKAINCRVPNQVGIGNGFDVEDEKGASHGLKLAEKLGKIPALRLA